MHAREGIRLEIALAVLADLTQLVEETARDDAGGKRDHQNAHDRCRDNDDLARFRRGRKVAVANSREGDGCPIQSVDECVEGAGLVAKHQKRHHEHIQAHQHECEGERAALRCECVDDNGKTARIAHDAHHAQRAKEHEARR